MKKTVPEIAPSLRATFADVHRSWRSLPEAVCTCAHGLSPLPRRPAEQIGRVQRELLGDVLGVAIHDPPQLT